MFTRKSFPQASSTTTTKPVANVEVSGDRVFERLFWVGVGNVADAGGQAFDGVDESLKDSRVGIELVDAQDVSAVREIAWSNRVRLRIAV